MSELGQAQLAGSGLRLSRPTANRQLAICRSRRNWKNSTPSRRRRFIICGLRTISPTIEETIRFATEINPHTIQISLAAPYPGTLLYKQALENGWLADERPELLSDLGTQTAVLNYPHLNHTEIFQSVEDFYRRFYFRAGKIASIVGEMVRSPQMMKRRLREGVEFFQFLRERQMAS